MLSRFSCVQLCVTLWTVVPQAPLSTGFFRQEYWSGLPYLSPEDLPNPGIEPVSLMSPALAGGFLTTSATSEILTEFLQNQLLASRNSLSFSRHRCQILMAWIWVYSKKYFRASLVIQLLGTHLAMQGTQTWSPWSRRIPHAVEQLSPCTTTIEPAL